MGTKMCQHVTDELSDLNISFSAKQTMSWEVLYELYRAPLRYIIFPTYTYNALVVLTISNSLFDTISTANQHKCWQAVPCHSEYYSSTII